MNAVGSPTYTITDQWCHLIDVTNHCPQQCIYCTRYEKHFRKDQLFHMTLEQIETALIAYQGAPGAIGIIGGEPLVHPEFQAICALIRRHYPRGKMHLFTALVPRTLYERYAQDIAATFGVVNANEHTPEKVKSCKHQITTMAVGETCDPQTAAELIQECWVPRVWCCTVNHKGAFFCELAAAHDVLLDGPGGWPVTPGWWRRTQAGCRDQQDRLCGLCGMCVPMKRQKMEDRKERFSPRLYQLYKDHNLARIGPDDVEVVDVTFDRDKILALKPTWTPWAYTDAREDHCPELHQLPAILGGGPRNLEREKG